MRFLSARANTGSLLYLATALALLPGRFDWSSQTRTVAWRGFDSSAFFLCILIPLAWAFVRRFTLSTVPRHLIMSGVTLLFALPYHWLGLDRFFYHRDHPRWLDLSSLPASPKLVWFPEAFREPSQIPRDFLFFLLLTLALFAIGWFFATLRRRSGKPLSTFQLALGASIAVLIIVETWMHLSMHSPYTYLCHFERPESEHYWYQVALFPDGRGMVNADYPLFLYLEETFMGTPLRINAMLIRRPFAMYLSSQFSYFFNPYYVMLCCNIVAWICASLAILDFVDAHFGRHIGVIAALLTASGPGFIMYAAQPQTYLWGFCAVALVIWAHWKICSNPDQSYTSYFLLGAILSLALLTYDLLTVLLYLLGYQLLFKKSVPKLFVSIVMALLIYVAFGVLTTHMKSLVHDPSNVRDIGRSVTSLLSLARSNPVSLQSYPLFGQALSNYFWNLSNAMFVFPVLVAFFGLFCLRDYSKLRLVGLLFLPSLASATFLFLGQTYLGRFPRFAFTAYPAVYTLCGILLCAIASTFSLWSKRAGTAFLALALASHVVLANIDVFGFPWLYYLFYYQQWAAPPPRL